MKRTHIFWTIKAVAMAVLGVTLVGFVVMGLWNALVPALFRGPALNFWQALGLLALTRLLIGSIFRGWRGRSGKSSHWRERWEAKLHRMTPEEREKIRQAYDRRCGHRRSAEAREAPAKQPEVVAGE